MIHRTTEYLWLIALIGAVGGCTNARPANPPPAINVTVDKDGHLSSLGLVLPDSELPIFAKEVGEGEVNVVFEGTYNAGDPPDFNTLVKARDKLRAAGVKHVSIGGISGK